jgi:hypothetical protein
MTEPIEDEQRRARAELSRERWAAHRDMHAGERELEDQKWKGHDEQHASIARNLAEYKTNANEWRTSLSDLRSTFTTRAESAARDTHIDSIEASLDRRFEDLRVLIAAEREERRDQQNLRAGERSGVFDTLGSGRNVLLLFVSLLVGIGVVVDIITRLHP